MKIEFRAIDLASFTRIWNSAHFDAHADSWKNTVENTPENEWKPVYEKWLPLMKEVYLDNTAVGYIFLSPKTDGSAHFGYGLYKNFRGKGHILPVCKFFLDETLPSLKNVTHIIGTCLKENLPSQIVLQKLGFDFYQETHEEHDYKQYIKKL